MRESIPVRSIHNAHHTHHTTRYREHVMSLELQNVRLTMRKPYVYYAP